MRTLVFCLGLLAASPAGAGAWLRADGTGFLATYVLQGRDGNSDGGLYFEYGVRPKLTLGVKADVNMTLGQLGDGRAFVFMRRAIPTGDRPYKLAYDLGIGSTFGVIQDPLLLTGVSYGRGLQWKERNGWLAIDSAVEWSLSGQATTAKLDATFGMALGKKTKGMLQVFLSHTETDFSATLAPSLIWQPKAKKPSYQIGLEAENGEVSLKLGLWRDF